jgi:NhaP-type Na+/H+ or K+/H+ antiporter
VRGVWYTTGGGGIVLPAVAVVLAIGAAEWAAARLWWIIGGAVACAVLTAAAVRWLIRRQESREALYAARRPAQLAAQPVTEIPRAQRQAIAGDLHVHFHGVPDGEHAAVIRQALGGGDG